jgi:hypothetical protein
MQYFYNGGAVDNIDIFEDSPVLIRPEPIGVAADVPPDMYRVDGTIKSLRGFLGPIISYDGKTMTELSIGMEIDGKETLMPSMVPTLTVEEIEILRNLKGGEIDKMPRSIIDKAVQHAIERMRVGRSPFYQDSESDLDRMNMFYNY